MALRKEIKKNGVVIVPIGAIEQHGPHLPTGTDSFTGGAIAKRVAEDIKCVAASKYPLWFF